jgi:hypothetical protein
MKAAQRPVIASATMTLGLTSIGNPLSDTGVPSLSPIQTGKIDFRKAARHRHDFLHRRGWGTGPNQPEGRPRLAIGKTTR